MVAVVSLESRPLAQVIPFPTARKDWREFDDRCGRVASREMSFEAFCLASKADFERMCRIATRKRRAPASMDQDDLVALARAHAWHYLFRHQPKGSDVVGFDPSRGPTAGAYVRWNVGKRLQKDLSRARGENQHRRDVKTSAPEVPMKADHDYEDERDGAEVAIDRAREFALLKAEHATTLEEHVILQAVIDAGGDDAAAACRLLGSAAYRFVIGARDEAAALRAIGTTIHAVASRRAKATREGEA